MPPGTLPPLVLQWSESVSLPVILVAITGPYSDTDLQDNARYNVRNFLGTVLCTERQCRGYTCGAGARVTETRVRLGSLCAARTHRHRRVNGLNLYDTLSGAGGMGSLLYVESPLGAEKARVGSR
jgi:hypothetical protein